ncbi:MAG: tetratricopeptide repeat protein [Bacteroidaceae bacterium]|nr:tetratricopeptide repeat protein [Bacteroidaceae bacterium]
MAKNKKASNDVIGLDVQLSKSEAFIEKHLKLILAILAVVIIVVSGIFLYRHYKANQTAEANEAIAASQNAFGMEQYEQALNGDGIQEKGFLKIIDEYSGTSTANLAKAYAGLCYLNLDRLDEAIKMLEEFDPQDDQMISPSAIAALGNCYVKKGENEKGAETLVKAANKANNDAVSPVFLLQAGEVYEELGKADKALELYKEIKSKYFRSPLSVEIDKYIERVSK